MADIWANSVACHPRAIVTLQGWEFTVMIPEPTATLQGAATWRIQCHDPRVSHCSCHRSNSMACHRSNVAGCCLLWIHCHDSRATLQGAATWRIQWHVIPQLRVTLQGIGLLPLGELNVMIPEPHATLQCAATWRIQCHDPSATCHIVGCNKSIRHIENRFSPYFIFFWFS